jgi:UDP-4-amino-4,6-dideoxy-N-acetyl-beta-L-altrosamine N-acetyltransferase
MYADHEVSLEEHAGWLASALSGPRRHWIIQLDGRSVGLASLGAIEAQARRCDWAFYLADPSVRGRGVGACVEGLILNHVFDDLGLNKLWCEVLADNEAVWRLHLSFGFREEARLRDHIKKLGAFRDVVGLGLLAKDWSRARGDCEARLRAGELFKDAVLIAHGR